jgi:hypothetical protein
MIVIVQTLVEPNHHHLDSDHDVFRGKHGWDSSGLREKVAFGEYDLIDRRFLVYWLVLVSPILLEVVDRSKVRFQFHLSKP